MKATELLSQIKIASPCHARWEDMSGDERSRFCGQCEKHVYNFSAMNAEEVADLIRSKEGKLCGRFYRRRDGTILTANCPVGAAKYLFRVKAFLGTSAALVLTATAVLVGRGDTTHRPKGPFAQKCDNILWTVKGWLGLNPKPRVTMGVVCMPISPPPNTVPPANGNSAGQNVAKSQSGR
jgi:hypothetical protein